MKQLISIEKLYDDIKHIIEEGKNNAYRAINFAMVQTYWHIGKLIVETEQSGKQRAEYGKELIGTLAKKLSVEYGKGFNSSNLWYMRQFYTTFEKLHALRGELSWTHYRLLLKVERTDARAFYMKESIECHWSTRTLERQVNSLYFERMVMTKKEEGKKLVMEENLPIIKITQNKRYMRLSDLNRYLNTKMVNKPQETTQEVQPDFQWNNIWGK